MKIIDKLAPPTLALKEDPVGLQVGDPADKVSGVLVTLDVDNAAVKQAEDAGANMIISHHPLIFSPLSSINMQTPGGALIRDIISKRINVFSAHTNLDIVPGGVNSVLAEIFELNNTEILEVTVADPLIKLVVFVPVDYEGIVRDALSNAGAGWIGNYSHCTFHVAGTGTFLPREGADPFIGNEGNLEKVSELRMETIFPESIKERVLEELFQSHPYEEPAYDLYPLKNKPFEGGLGLIGDLKEPLSLKELAGHCAKVLKTRAVRGWGEKDKKVKKVAVCGGSGGSLIKSALRKNADVFISGDFKYHDISFAGAEGLALLDAGHYATEYPIIPRLADYLKAKLTEGGHRVEVLVASRIDERECLIIP